MPGIWYLPNKLPNKLTLIPSFRSPVTQFLQVFPALGYKWVPLTGKMHLLLVLGLPASEGHPHPPCLLSDPASPQRVLPLSYLHHITSALCFLFCPASPPGPVESVSQDSTGDLPRVLYQCSLAYAHSPSLHQAQPVRGALDHIALSILSSLLP